MQCLRIEYARRADAERALERLFKAPRFWGEASLGPDEAGRWVLDVVSERPLRQGVLAALHRRAAPAALPPSGIASDTVAAMDGGEGRAELGRKRPAAAPLPQDGSGRERPRTVAGPGSAEAVPTPRQTRQRPASAAAQAQLAMQLSLL